MEPDLEEQGIIRLRNGTTTHRWEDGSGGVPETLLQYAREVDVLEKPAYFGDNDEQGDDDFEAATWLYVFVSADGHFQAWAPAPTVEAEDPKALFKAVTRRHHQERWCFTAYELEHPEDCKSHDEFVADLGGDQEGLISELGVLVQRNGDVTNRWGDGTVGVGDEYRQLADKSDTLVKPYRQAGESDVYADTWREVIVDKEGKFVAWAAEKARQVIDNELLSLLRSPLKREDKPQQT